MKRSEIEDLLKDDIAFREELVDDRDSAIERAEVQYAKALAEADESRKRAEREYRDALDEVDNRIRRADRAIQRWKDKLAQLDE